MSHTHKDFDLDTWAEKFALNDLSKEELRQLSIRLSHDNKLREELCDWLKGLRDLGWPSIQQSKKGKIS